MRVYDCFPFYNEIELLEYRLRLLYDVVDYFVISEMHVTHQGRAKGWNFLEHQELFAPYMDKIRYLQVTDTEGLAFSPDNIWPLENYQRDVLVRGLTDAEPEDIIFCSDLDELPDPQVVRAIKDGTAPCNLIYPFGENYERRGLKPRQHLLKWRHILTHLGAYLGTKNVLEVLEHSPIALEQAMHLYYINYRRRSNWNGTVAMLYKNIGGLRLSQHRWQRNIIPTVRGGWHLSYMGGASRIVTKLESIAEGELNQLASIPPAEREDYIARAIESGGVFEVNDQITKLAPAEMDLPDIEWFITKYPQFYRV